MEQKEKGKKRNDSRKAILSVLTECGYLCIKTF